MRNFRYEFRIRAVYETPTGRTRLHEDPRTFYSRLRIL